MGCDMKVWDCYLLWLPLAEYLYMEFVKVGVIQLNFSYKVYLAYLYVLGEMI